MNIALDDPADVKLVVIVQTIHVKPDAMNVSIGIYTNQCVSINRVISNH